MLHETSIRASGDVRVATCKIQFFFFLPKTGTAMAVPAVVAPTALYYDLQVDVNNLCAWTDGNNMKFNATKCKYMIISRKKQPIIPNSPLVINNCCLERVNFYKYLGVWITSTLNWSTHISEICTKARRQAGIIYRKLYDHTSSSTLFFFFFFFFFYNSLHRYKHICVQDAEIALG